MRLTSPMFSVSLLALFLVGAGVLLAMSFQGNRSQEDSFQGLLEVYRREGTRPDPEALVGRSFSGICHHREGFSLFGALLVGPEGSGRYQLLTPFLPEPYERIEQVMDPRIPRLEGILEDTAMRVLPGRLPDGSEGMPAFLKMGGKDRPLLLMGPSENNPFTVCSYRPLIPDNRTL